uniref:Putative chibby n=1 Tax=Xenopsylla cheopis TaxID=163159 RepID=A0A6M2DHF9_XENCH
MPLFFNKFAQRKTPMRKSGKLISEGTREDNNRSDTELTPIKFKLGEQEVQFNAGQWTSDNKDQCTEKQRYYDLQQYAKDLQQENNILKLKVELLLDMLAESTADNIYKT